MDVNSSIDYYDMMIIGRAGMGKSTTADKLIIANPDCRDYTGEQHADEIFEGGQMKLSDLSIWLISDAENELERVTTRLKNLTFFRSLDKPHEHVNLLYNKRAKMATSRPQLISNETTKVRVLDVPEFFKKETGQSVMHEILQIQSTMRMKFRRIVYFIPERGPLERSHAVLLKELEQMVHYFGKSIFECMVLVATVNPDVYQYLPSDVVPFSEAAKELTRMNFQAALAKVLPDGGTFPADKPTIVFLSMNDPCEEVIKKIADAPVICDELKFAFDHRVCIRCGLKVKILQCNKERISCYADEDPMASVPYEESLCHPLIVSRYRTITKAVGGIAHFVTAKKFMGLWPDFRNPDDEICIECGRVPGEPGCKKIGSHFQLEGEEYKVDHAPIQRVVVANQEQPDFEKQYEGDNHRHCNQP